MFLRKIVNQSIDLPLESLLAVFIKHTIQTSFKSFLLKATLFLNLGFW